MAANCTTIEQRNQKPLTVGMKGFSYLSPVCMFPWLQVMTTTDQCSQRQKMENIAHNLWVLENGMEKEKFLETVGI